MKRLQYKIEINAPVNKVTEKMLGKQGYSQWTSVFNASSRFEGSWEKGEKIHFIGTDKEGKEEGMVAEIAAHIPGQFVSVRHYGVLKNGKEVFEGPEVEKWAGGYENYHFEESDGVTTVIVDVDVTEDNMDYINDTYPKALEKLKEITEA